MDLSQNIISFASVCESKLKFKKKVFRSYNYGTEFQFEMFENYLTGPIEMIPSLNTRLYSKSNLNHSLLRVQ